MIFIPLIVIKAFIIVDGDFVTAEEGTGIVTIAAYGEEDLVVMQKENIQIMLHVDDEGMIKRNSKMERNVLPKGK